MIRYIQVKNKMNTAATAPYLPKTVLEGSLSFEQFIKACAYGSTITTADVKAVFENIERVCIENLSQGISVHLGFCKIRSQVKGIFQSEEDNFTIGKHRIQVSISPHPKFQKKIAANSEILKVIQKKKSPILLSLKNHSSESETSVKVGDLLSVYGENMRFEKTSTNLGLFFEQAGVEVRVSEYAKVTGKIVSFKVPEGLLNGKMYRLKLKCIFGREVRTGVLDNPLTVS